MTRAPARTVKRLDSLGTPARPLGEAGLIAKFDELVAPTGLALTGRDVAARIGRLPAAPNLDELLAPFLAEPRPTG